jgi:adenylate kinase
MAALGADGSFVIVLIGPTGSGKTTQAAFLQSRYGLATIAADDLIKQNPQALAKYQTPGIDPGVPQANPALNDLVRERLSRMDAKKGFVLDGYPATKDQADHLERW